METAVLSELSSSPTCLQSPWELVLEFSCIPATFELQAFWQVAFWAHLIVILFISLNIAQVKNDGWTLLPIPVSVFHHFVLDVSGFVITFGPYLDLYIKFFDTMNKYAKAYFARKHKKKPGHHGLQLQELATGNIEL
ncbi:hypothetical protein OIU79_005028 [Salix purpurea]|uniref:Uncharacterized protein n=1 Tax=Salix purpurea TaxID=77065 RepID=A0A9Q0UBR6_SALPP|nr:hypothetical protein OIU79_005028 [Salix purpurea]